MTNDAAFTAMADAAERGELQVKPGTVLRGDDAAAYGHQMLMDATGAGSIEEATRMILGRPTLAEAGRGPSPTWRIRTTPALHAAVQHEADVRGIPVSSVIREAVAQHLERSH